MDYKTLEGALATLDRLDDGQDVASFLTRLKEPAFQHAALEFGKIPDQKTLEEDLEEESWAIWKILPEGAEQEAGYVGFVLNCGAPYLFLHFLSGKLDLAVAQDVLPLATRYFFEVHDREAFYLFVDLPVSPEILEALLDGGFDEVEDMPAVDSKKVMSFKMLRETYEAYYGEEEDEVDELDF